MVSYVLCADTCVLRCAGTSIACHSGKHSRKEIRVRRFLEGCMKREDQNHLQLVGEAAASDSGIP